MTIELQRYLRAEVGAGMKLQFEARANTA